MLNTHKLHILPRRTSAHMDKYLWITNHACIAKRLKCHMWKMRKSYMCNTALLLILFKYFFSSSILMMQVLFSEKALWIASVCEKTSMWPLTSVWPTVHFNDLSHTFKPTKSQIRKPPRQRADYWLTCWLTVRLDWHWDVRMLNQAGLLFKNQM